MTVIDREDSANVTDVVFEGVPNGTFDIKTFFRDANSLRSVSLRNVLAPKHLDEVNVSDLDAFELSNYPLTPDEIPTLVDIVRKSPHLTRLHLERVPLGLKGIRALFPYLHGVCDLRFIRCDLGVQSFRWLSQLPACSIEIVPTPTSFFDFDYQNLRSLTVSTKKVPQAFLDRHPNITALKIVGAEFNDTFRAPPQLNFIHLDQCRITDDARWVGMENVENAFLGFIDVSSPRQLHELLKSLRDVITLGFHTYQSNRNVYADQFYELMRLTRLKTVLWTPRSFCSHKVNTAAHYVSKYHPTCAPFWSKNKSEHPARILALTQTLNEDMCRVVASYLFD